jgi:hypothetical protein
MPSAALSRGAADGGRRRRRPLSACGLQPPIDVLGHEPERPGASADPHRWNPPRPCGFVHPRTRHREPLRDVIGLQEVHGFALATSKISKTMIKERLWRTVASDSAEMADKQDEDIQTAFQAAQSGWATALRAHRLAPRTPASALALQSSLDE